VTADIIGKCWSCGRPLTGSDLGRETLCLGCHKPTRVCKNCSWYDSAKTHQCGEAILEPVKDKERANYCDFFQATENSAGDKSDSKDSLIQAAEDLFK